MATYDLGDVVSLSFEIRDSSGVLADASAVTLTMTLPDGTTQPLNPTHPSTGVYTATYSPPGIGRYRACLVATGANAGSHTTGFTVTSGEAVEALISPARVAAKGRVELPAGGVERQALDDAVIDATGIVLGFLRRPTADSLAPHARAAVQAVAVRVALRLWRNPSDVASESYGGDVSHTTDPRLLTGDEQDTLLPYQSKVRGPIRLLPRLPEEVT